MMSTLRLGRPFAAWALAALLFAPPSAATDLVTVRAVTGLPRVGIAAGQALAWRNVGIAVESELADAEVKVASCLPAMGATVTTFDRAGTGCAASPGTFATGNLGQQYGLTLKLPRATEGGPRVDLALRSWRAPTRVGSSGESGDGSVAELNLTQALGSVDALFGYSTPVAFANARGRWRSTFAGVTWYAARGTRFELAADRSVETATATLDRTITLRFVHATATRSTRLAAWATRALDDRSNAWQVGAGFDIAF